VIFGEIDAVLAQDYSMPIKLPKLMAIDHDDYYAEFIGKTADGVRSAKKDWMISETLSLAVLK